MTYYRLEQIRGIDRCLEKVLAARREGSRRDRQPGHRSAPAGSCAAEWRSVLLYTTPHSHRRVHQHPSETAATGPNTSVWNSNPCARAGYSNRQKSEGRQVKPAALRRQSSRGLTTDRHSCEPEAITLAENCQMPCHINCHSSSDTRFRIS